METPTNTQHSGELAVREAAKRIHTARAGFPDALAHALKVGVGHERIVEICAEEGLDQFAVRALLELPEGSEAA